MTLNNLTQALTLAGDGLPVFPASPSTKAPLVPGGFHAATISRKQIETWWTENPDALVAVPTGAASGLDALDLDPRNGGNAWLEANAERVRGSRVHRTRSGGVHILFRHADGLRLSAGRVAPGVDIRADGGYVVWWPAHGFKAAGPAAKPWPADLLAQVRTGQTRALDTSGRDPAEIAPPSAEAVVELLDALPNPIEADRDVYTSVMLAARGCIQGLEAVGQVDGLGEIEEAAIRWAERWEGGNEINEREKWENDWSTRDAPLAGWQALQRHAGRMVPGYPEAQAAREFAAAPIEAGPTLIDELDAKAWADLDLPPTKQYLGYLLQTATKLNLIGSTGLGKSQLSHAMACGIASGEGFGPWRTDSPSRVLVMDGEMSTRLVKARIGAAVRRHGRDIPHGNLVVYALDRSDYFAERFPGLGKFQPLNLPDGRAFLKRLVQRVEPEVVIFDNVMSLMNGDQKDEVTWSGALDLMGDLTQARIAQVWLDHTGHGPQRQYGSSTKMWRADAVGVMQPVEKAEVLPGEVKFTLTFNAPQGKARERDGANHLEFADRTFTMDEHGWKHSTSAKAATVDGPAERVPPAVQDWYDALVAVCENGEAREEVWWDQACRKELVDRIRPGDNATVRDRKRAKLRKAISELQAARWIRGEEGVFYDLRGGGDLAAITA